MTQPNDLPPLPEPAQPDSSAATSVVVGAMHRILPDARFPVCIECGCESDQFARPCKAYLKQASAAWAFVSQEIKGKP